MIYSLLYPNIFLSTLFSNTLNLSSSLNVCIFGFKGASTSKVIGALNEMMMDDYDGQMIFGDLVGPQLPDIHLTGEEKPRKNLTRKLVPTGDRTRARCVTSAHATTCSTAVDSSLDVRNQVSQLYATTQPVT